LALWLARKNGRVNQDFGDAEKRAVVEFCWTTLKAALEKSVRTAVFAEKKPVKKTLLRLV
jgi:hypothetical protein